MDKLLDSQQSVVTDHFRPEPEGASIRQIPYSDTAFQTAAIEWLVQTNQVCFNYLSFLSLYLFSQWGLYSQFRHSSTRHTRR